MGKFQPGNVAAIGNKGGGRPPKLLRDLTTADAPRIWRELTRIALDPAHPQHARHGFDALKTLALLAFPRPQAILLDATPEAAADSVGIMELFAERIARRLDMRREGREHDGNVSRSSVGGDELRAGCLLIGTNGSAHSSHAKQRDVSLSES